MYEMYFSQFVFFSVIFVWASTVQINTKILIFNGIKNRKRIYDMCVYSPEWVCIKWMKQLAHALKLHVWYQGYILYVCAYLYVHAMCIVNKSFIKQIIFFIYRKLSTPNTSFKYLKSHIVWIHFVQLHISMMCDNKYFNVIVNNILQKCIIWFFFFYTGSFCWGVRNFIGWFCGLETKSDLLVVVV